jgi:hypothetical protein
MGWKKEQSKQPAWMDDPKFDREKAGVDSLRRGDKGWNLSPGYFRQEDGTYPDFHPGKRAWRHKGSVVFTDEIHNPKNNPKRWPLETLFKAHAEYDRWNGKR